MSLVLVMAGCSDLSGSAPFSGSANTAEGQGVRGEVEDPDTFARREAGLWDGRPSLGGLWVAHPEALTPERVVIRNIENGQETFGALFRRERLNPGPSFQLSAEAATALGILAGSPTEIEVIALRQTPPADVEIASSQDEGAASDEDIAEPAPDDPDTVPSADSVAPRGFFRRLFGQDQAALHQGPEQRQELGLTDRVAGLMAQAHSGTGQGGNLAPRAALGFNAERDQRQL